MYMRRGRVPLAGGWSFRALGTRELPGRAAPEAGQRRLAAAPPRHDDCLRGAVGGVAVAEWGLPFLLAACS